MGKPYFFSFLAKQISSTYDYIQSPHAHRVRISWFPHVGFFCDIMYVSRAGVFTFFFFSLLCRDTNFENLSCMSANIENQSVSF